MDHVDIIQHRVRNIVSFCFVPPPLFFVFCFVCFCLSEIFSVSLHNPPSYSYCMLRYGTRGTSRSSVGTLTGALQLSLSSASSSFFFLSSADLSLSLWLDHSENSTRKKPFAFEKKKKKKKKTRRVKNKREPQLYNEKRTRHTLNCTLLCASYKPAPMMSVYCVPPPPPNTLTILYTSRLDTLMCAYKCHQEKKGAFSIIIIHSKGKTHKLKENKKEHNSKKKSRKIYVLNEKKK